MAAPASTAASASTWTATAARKTSLAGSSAYLARDLDGNGAVDSGKELFGPTTGNGFAELATHDADRNGWIDEADPIWGDLRLWRPDTTGAGRLTTLAAEGVGAIAVASVATPFTVKYSYMLDLFR